MTKNIGLEAGAGEMIGVITQDQELELFVSLAELSRAAIVCDGLAVVALREICSLLQNPGNPTKLKDLQIELRVVRKK